MANNIRQDQIQGVGKIQLDQIENDGVGGGVQAVGDVFSGKRDDFMSYTSTITSGTTNNWINGDVGSGDTLNLTPDDGKNIVFNFNGLLRTIHTIRFFVGATSHVAFGAWKVEVSSNGVDWVTVDERLDIFSQYSRPISNPQSGSYLRLTNIGDDSTPTTTTVGEIYFSGTVDDGINIYNSRLTEVAAPVPYTPYVDGFNVGWGCRNWNIGIDMEDYTLFGSQVFGHKDWFGNSSGKIAYSTNGGYIATQASTGKNITFDYDVFGNGRKVALIAMHSRANNGVDHGTHILEYSDDNIIYTPLGSSFDFEGGEINTVTLQSDNSSLIYARYWRLAGQVGLNWTNNYLRQWMFSMAVDGDVDNGLILDRYRFGDRTGILTVTTDATIAAGSANDWVNETQLTSDKPAFTNTQDYTDTKIVGVQFPTAEKLVSFILPADGQDAWYNNGASSNPNAALWSIRYSDDGIAWTKADIVDEGLGQQFRLSFDASTPPVVTDHGAHEYWALFCDTGRVNGATNLRNLNFVFLE